MWNTIKDKLQLIFYISLIVVGVFGVLIYASTLLPDDTARKLLFEGDSGVSRAIDVEATHRKILLNRIGLEYDDPNLNGQFSELLEISETSLPPTCNLAATSRGIVEFNKSLARHKDHLYNHIEYKLFFLKNDQESRNQFINWNVYMGEVELAFGKWSGSWIRNAEANCPEIIELMLERANTS